jgi:hypothetical protein
MSSLNFDQYQFEGSRAFPVSAKTGISYEDYRSMQTATRGATPVAWVPPFALNDKLLQKVLLLRVWRYVHSSSPMPETINREEISHAATKKALRSYAIRKTAAPIQNEILIKHIAAVRRAGGFLQLHAAIAFRSWRLGMDSVSVAQSVGMTPQAVRQALWRMRDMAKKLGYDVGRAGHTAGVYRRQIAEAEALDKYKSGKSISKVATELECSSSCIRRILKDAGCQLRRPGKSKKPRQGGGAVVADRTDGISSDAPAYHPAI